MAKATMKGLVDEIENMCECNICCAKYDERNHVPRVLPCQHTFCSECLSKQCKRQKLKCSFCNQEHDVKNGDVRVFPKDNTRRDLKELLEKFPQSLCEICQNHDHLSYFCAVCNIRMCSKCYEGRKSKACKTHGVEILENAHLTSGTFSNTSDAFPKRICWQSDHENNELKFFCSEKPCSTPVCANCIVESHKNHSYRPIKDEYENRKTSMQSSFQATNNKINTAKKLLENVEEEYKTRRDSAKQGRERLSAEANRGIKYIREYEQDVKNKANTNLQENLNILKKKREQLKYFIENATECCAISQNALNGSNIVTFLSVEKTLAEKLKFFEQYEVDKPIEAMSNEDLMLQTPISKLREKMNKMMRTNDESIDNPSWFRRFRNILWEYSQRPDRPSCLSVFASMLGVILLYSILLLSLFPIPYTRYFKTDNSYLAFRHTQPSLMCYSADGGMVSNIPIQYTRQSCGNTQKLYIFNGGFINKSFVYGNDESVTFEIHLSRIRRYFADLILFEFGISKGSVERRHLMGPPSVEFYGWYLKLLNQNREFALVNTEGQIVLTGLLSVLGESSFVFVVELESNRTISLKVRNKNMKSYKTLDKTRSIKGKPKWGFVKMCNSYQAQVAIEAINANLAFNKSTLYPGLYISSNGKTISNTHIHSSGIKPIKKGSNYQDIMLLNCRNDCVYVIHFRVNSPQNSQPLSLVLTNSQFLPSASYNVTLLSYKQCTVTKLMQYPSYCLFVDNSVQHTPYFIVEMLPNMWHSLSITVHRKYQRALFRVGKNLIEIQDGFMFESGIPILRWIMHDMVDSVEIMLGDRDEFDVLTWIAYEILLYVGNFLPFYRSYMIFVTSICCFICIYHRNDIHTSLSKIYDYLYLHNIIWNTTDRNGNMTDNVERRRRVRRQRFS